MRRMLAVFSVVVITALAAGAAQGTWYDGIALDNIYNSSTDPHAATNGLLWIVSGSGTVLLNNDINIEFTGGQSADSLTLWYNPGRAYYHDPGYGPLYSTFLLSDGTAAGGITFFGNGDFIDPFGAEWVMTTGPQTSAAYFQIKAWTGNYNTYDAAYTASADGVAGVYVARSPVFSNPVAGFDPPMPPGDLTDMPAMILTFPGDANGDGKVDINDLSVVLTNYDRTAATSWATGDFTGDGKVDINDLSAVLSNYDRHVGSSAAGVAAVPEPGALALLAAGIGGTLVWMLRRPR